LTRNCGGKDKGCMLSMHQDDDVKKKEVPEEGFVEEAGS
jgi:hypothetical protein